MDGGEGLEPSLISLQLRQDNDRLRQAVDVMTRAHAELSDDLTMKNSEIVQLQTNCSDFKLQVTELSEKVNLTELELAECKKDGSQCTAQVLELSAECVRLRDRISAADSDIATLYSELESRANSVDQKQTRIDDLQEQLSAEFKKTQMLVDQLGEQQNELMLQQDEVMAASVKNSDLTVQNADLQQKLQLAEKECSNLQLSLNELRKTSDSASGELRQQIQCLQNDYHQNVQLLNTTEERCETLRLQCDQLMTENATLKLQVLDRSEQVKMQAKIDNLEQALQDNVKAHTESRQMAEECSSEKAAMQTKLINAENERDSLRTEFSDCSIRYQNTKKSLLELQEKLVQRDQQIEEKDCSLNYARQQTADIKGALVALEQQLKQEESEKMERKQQLKKLKVESEDLKKTVTTQSGAIADVLKAKEDSDKQTALLQLQAEHLTSERVSLEQQVRILEDSNISVKKDLSVITDNYESAKKEITELQLHVDQLLVHERSLSDQLGSLRLLCGQKDEVIRLSNSEKEEISCSLAALREKADADAVEVTTHIRRISELEQHNTAVEDKMGKLSAEKQVLADELSACEDVIKRQKQSVADAEHENERYRKVISDFEEQSLSWRDEKLILQGRITELENCVTRKQKEVQTMQEKQEVERTSSDNLPVVKNFDENVMVSNKDLNNITEHDMLEKHELVQNLHVVDQKSVVEKNVYNDCAMVRNLHSEADSGKLRECPSLLTSVQEMCDQLKTEKPADSSVTLKVEQMLSCEHELECDVPAEVDKGHCSETENTNLQQLMSQNVVPQRTEHLELTVKRASERVDASDSLSESDRNVAKDSASKTDYKKQCHLKLAAGSERSSAVSASHECDQSVSCAKDGSTNKELLNVEKVVCSNDAAVKTTTDPDTASKQEDLDTQCGGQRKIIKGQRRVIKCFTRLPQSSATLKHNSKPLSVCSGIVPNLHARAVSSVDMNIPSIAGAVKQLSASQRSLSNEASSGSVNEISSATNLQANTSNTAAQVPAVATTSDATRPVSMDIRSVSEAASSQHLSLCQQLSCLQANIQALGEHGKHNTENRNGNQNAAVECSVRQNVFTNSDINSDNKSVHPHNKRVTTDTHDGDAKKLRSG